MAGFLRIEWQHPAIPGDSLKLNRAAELPGLSNPPHNEKKCGAGARARAIRRLVGGTGQARAVRRRGAVAVPGMRYVRVQAGV